MTTLTIEQLKRQNSTNSLTALGQTLTNYNESMTTLTMERTTNSTKSLMSLGQPLTNCNDQQYQFIYNVGPTIDHP